MSPLFFAGLPLSTLSLVFGGVAACVGVLYILKLRRRVVAVPFSPLWQRVLADQEATSLFSKLRRLLSLLLQLVLLGLLVLALGDPRLAETFSQGRTLVVLLDASASMAATDVAPSRLEGARQQARKLISSLGPADRMLLAQMDALVTPLGPLSGDVPSLERALEHYKGTEAKADFPRALRFAIDALRETKAPEIVVISDGHLGPATDAAGPVHLGNIRLSYVPLGEGARNVGLTQFSVRRYPLDRNRYEVMLEVSNTGPEAEEVELSLLGDGELVDMTKLRLQPGERLPRFYPNLSGARRTLEARLAPLPGSQDILAVDNHAYALLPERRRATILVVSPGNMYLEAALLLDEFLEVTSVTPQQYPATLASGSWDAMIFDGATPAEMPKVPALYIDPRGPGSPVKVGDSVAQPGFDKVERKHPLVRFLALEDVNIARGHKLIVDGAAGDRVVGASEQGPLLVAGTRGGFRFAVVGFDVRESDLPLRTAWPIFLMNTLRWFADDDDSYLSSVTTGQVWRIPLGDKHAQARLHGPGGFLVDVPVQDGKAVFLGQSTGFFRVEPVVGSNAGGSQRGGANAGPLGLGGSEVGVEGPGAVAFAANLLDGEESSVAKVNELVVDGKTAGAVEGFSVGVRRELWVYFLLAALGLTVLEWLTYHRRVTV